MNDCHFYIQNGCEVCVYAKKYRCVFGTICAFSSLDGKWIGRVIFRGSSISVYIWCLSIGNNAGRGLAQGSSVRALWVFIVSVHLIKWALGANANREKKVFSVLLIENGSHWICWCVWCLTIGCLCLRIWRVSDIASRIRIPFIAAQIIVF